MNIFEQAKQVVSGVRRCPLCGELCSPDVEAHPDCIEDYEHYWREYDREHGLRFPGEEQRETREFLEGGHE